MAESGLPPETRGDTAVVEIETSYTQQDKGLTRQLNSFPKVQPFNVCKAIRYVLQIRMGTLLRSFL